MRFLGWVKRLWGRSLLTRSIITMVACTAIAVTLGSYLMIALTSSSLFEARRERVLLSANRAASQAQSMLSASSVSSQANVQSLLYSVLATTESVTASQNVALLRTPGQADSASLDVTSSAVNRTDIPLALRSKVGKDPGQIWWQSIALAENGNPGIVAGVGLNVPSSGLHELYIVYDLGADQVTLRHLEWMLVVGGIAIVLLVGLITWGVVGRVLRPVKDAANTSEKIAHGDLTQRMRIRGNDEVTTLATSFNSMANSLQVKITELASLTQMQQRFVSDVSHELRTPLATIRLAADTIYAKREGFDPVTARSSELLFDQTNRFETLLADLLEMSRFDAHQSELDLMSVDLGQVTRRIVTDMHDVSVAQNSELSLKVTGDVVVDGDSSRLERIIRNLVANALEYGAGTPVEIQVAGDDNSVCVAVQDYGEGLTRAEMERVFDRFWRKDPSRERTLGGTGLGLSIASEDTALHGGRLDVWSNQGEGTCFRLAIPRTFGDKITGSTSLPLRLPLHQDDATGNVLLGGQA